MILFQDLSSNFRRVGSDFTKIHFSDQYEQNATGTLNICYDHSYHNGLIRKIYSSKRQFGRQTRTLQ